MWVGDGLLDDLWWCASFVFSVLFIGGFVCSSLTLLSLLKTASFTHCSGVDGNGRPCARP